MILEMCCCIIFPNGSSQDLWSEDAISTIEELINARALKTHRIELAGTYFQEICRPTFDVRWDSYLVMHHLRIILMRIHAGTSDNWDIEAAPSQPTISPT